ncbi:glycosyltransferase family 4 protein [Rhodopirellula sp. MGV]|uniref:glycosyltransferase family 4 protein n=1 Tax=Rhodopirellula sp. MGV TaxID=2023130 RepID=UPI000B96280F|nr:glycosyltransferase family 4 protein [Rhodopirellula sp. MGV]OYP39152.1 hypothetical protein CGZ80_00450 [Rhodopirellula sp. MGV]PNY35471.1 hypothetical protein C2E31_18390 [Rhodopirellula baltica]
MKLAFVTSHPIQYQVPIFRLLANRSEIDFTALFAMVPGAKTQGDGFGVEFQWDVPLLDGYRFEVLDNIAKSPSVTRFSGCDTPLVGETLRKLKADVVVVNGWVVKTCLQTLKSCRQIEIPCLVRGEANRLRPRPWWKRALQRQLVRRFNGFLPIGGENRRFYKSYGISEEAMFDARYCVDNDRFAANAASIRTERESLRQRWSIPTESTCFLYCGKFEQKKHPMELLHAFRQAASRQTPNAPMHLLMVGDGELRKDCQQYAQSHQLPVSFTGFLNQSEIVASYVASDCLVLPSDHGETWGLVVNEAMACGLPAIVSDQVGCHSDLIRQGETGFVFPFADWNALSESFCHASSAKVDLAQLGHQAFQLIQDYSPRAAAEGIVDAARWARR